MKERASQLARFLDGHFDGRRNESVRLPDGHSVLQEACRYSLLQEGSKRFRPVLAMLTAEGLNHRPEKVLPFGAAIECIHTYSLIHDDLPSMDNDDFRRGQPTSHKKFGEATAILAGDALLTEAFQMIADHYSSESDIAIRLVSETAKAAGLFGMVGGQAIDMNAKTSSESKLELLLSSLQTMHRLKTGALIRVSAVGAALICRASDNQLNEITRYAEDLGLAFQVADDILDYNPEKLEPGSYPALVGLEKTKALLGQLTESCLESLKTWSEAADPLREIARYNMQRRI